MSRVADKMRERIGCIDGYYRDADGKPRTPLTDLADEVEHIEDENAKLRELAETMLHDAMENVCSKSYWCDEKSWQTCNDESCGSHLYVEMARELGIEVDW